MRFKHLGLAAAIILVVGVDVASADTVVYHGIECRSVDSGHDENGNANGQYVCQDPQTGQSTVLMFQNGQLISVYGG